MQYLVVDLEKASNNRLNQTRLLSQNLLPGFAWKVLRQSQARWLSARSAGVGLSQKALLLGLLELIFLPSS